MIVGSAIYGSSVGYVPPRLYSPIPGLPLGLIEPPNQATERTVIMVRPIQISILQGQTAWIKITIADFGGFLNSSLKITLGTDGPEIIAGQWGELSIGAGTHIVNVVFAYTVRGAQPVVRSIDYDLQVTPNAQLVDVLGAYDATVGSMTRVEGVLHKALEFNGMYDYVTLPDYGFRGAVPRGVSLVVNTEDGGPMIQLGSETSIDLVDGKLTVVYLGVPYELSSAIINDGQWHFILVLYDGSAWHAFIDTVQTSDMTLSIDTSDGLNYLGRAVDSYFKGVMDKIVILSGSAGYMDAVKIMNYQSPRDQEIVAKRLNGAVVGTLSYWDGVTPVYPENPVNGQEHNLYDTTTGVITRKVFVNGSWR